MACRYVFVVIAGSAGFTGRGITAGTARHVRAPPPAACPLDQLVALPVFKIAIRLVRCAALPSGGAFGME